MLRLSLILAAAALAGCATRGPAGLDLDTSVNAVSQSSRVRAIVIHYTTEDDARPCSCYPLARSARTTC